MSSLKVIISGGGTGGHIFPAIAIANALKEKDPNAEILFVGARGRMEMEKIPVAGYEIIGLPIRGYDRSGLWSNLILPFLLLKSFWISFRTILKFNPAVVVGVGGYASGAIVFTASMMGKKTLIQEQNSFPGVTNRILGKYVNIICSGFRETESQFPKRKVRLLGNPVRENLRSASPKTQESFSQFNLEPEGKVLLAIGGSLGARTINRCMLQLIPLLDSMNFQLLWQCGSYYYENLKNDERIAHGRVHLFQFIERMDLAYACSDLVISRAGALSVSEIALLRKPSILIPSPNVSEDHQTRNAKALTDFGAAVLVPDDVAEQNIAREVTSLMNDESRLVEIKQKMELVFSNPDAASDIAGEIINLAMNK